MQQENNKNTLIIYQDTSKNVNTEKLTALFDIVCIPKLVTVDFNDFKLKGNHLVTSYNDILYTTNSELAFFICASELDNSTINTLSGYKSSGSDFSFFTVKKTNNLITSLSGLVVKTDILLKIGFFDKHTFHNLFLNFIINYSRYYGLVPDSVFTGFKIGNKDYKNYKYWSYFEKASYLSRPLHKQVYKQLSEKMETAINRGMFKKYIDKQLQKKMEPLAAETEKTVESLTYLEYW